jgi:hypothetical protein
MKNLIQKISILLVGAFLISLLVIGIAKGDITLWYLDGTTLKPVDPTWNIDYGILTVGEGGTGLTTTTRGALLVGTSTSAYYAMATGTEGYVLTISGGIPAWSSGAVAGVSSLNTLTGALTLWGTENQLTVSASGTAGVIFSTPQNIHTGASPTFSNLEITNGISSATGTFMGNVGIGTSSPISLLNLASINPKFYFSDTDAVSGSKHFFLNYADGLLSMGTSSDSLLSDTTFLTLSSSTTTNSIVSFYNANNHIMTMGVDIADANTFKISTSTDFTSGNIFNITTSGKIGIGTTTPASILHIDKGSSGTTTVTIGSAQSVGCLKIEDTDKGGFTYCTVLNGTMICSQTSCE